MNSENSNTGRRKNRGDHTSDTHGSGRLPVRLQGRLPVKEEKDENDAVLSAAVVRALEHPPSPVVPESFAGRVAQLAATQTLSRRSVWDGFGLRAAMASGVLLTGALFGFAPHALPSFLNLRFDLEMLLLMELGGVAYLITRVGLRD